MFDLTARLVLHDQMTAPLRRAMRTTGEMDNILRRTRTATETVSRAAHGMGTAFSSAGNSASRSLASMTRSTGGLAKSIVGIGAAYVSANAAALLFDKTIGAAAEREMSNTTIQALFKGDTTNAKKYFDFIDQRAIESMFSQKDFLGTGSAFIPVMKDLESIKTATKLAERLGASNPLEGLEGAAYSIRELISGDGESIADRFNLPKNVVNQMTKLPIAQQMKALDMLLDKMGFTEQFLQEQGKTAMSQYSQAVDKVNISLQKMGMQALDKLKPALVKVNDALDTDQFKRFTEIGSSALAQVAEGSIRALSRMKNYAEDHFINNPDFTKLTDFESRVSFVFDSLGDTWNTWYNSGGSKMITGVSDKVVATLVNSLEASAPVLLPIAKNMGVSVAEGIISGFSSAIASIPVVAKTNSLIDGFMDNMRMIGDGKFSDFGSKYVSDVKQMWKDRSAGYGVTSSGNGVPDYYNTEAPSFSKNLSDVSKSFDASNPFRSASGYAGGLSRVGYNGMPARLHKDEMVLDKASADEYRASRGGNGGGGVTVTGNTFNVRQESDIDAIAKALASQAWGMREAVR